ncbi:hypothetical protein SLS62_001174 [Diatrype stigma]|uniref:Major facilitator superfamily (MFS) profile domain-containing protein n=1 Tax=Diatrype stigma TaxID=117547 RepID=A0AAN9UZF0_9PEZI
MTARSTEYDVSGTVEEQKSAAGTGGSSTPLEEKSPDFEPAPDGGLRAWLVATGAGFIFFTAVGYSSSFGVFQEYYTHNQLSGESPDKIAWIGSLAACLQFATGAFAGPAFDRYGPWILRPAMVLYIFAIMMTSLCSKYWQFTAFQVLAQSVLLGIATGLMVLPALAAVSQHFDKRRAAALGVAVSGSSLGGIVFPVVLSKLLNGSPLGFGWSVRAVGFIMAPLLGFACAAIRARLPPRPATFFIGAAFRQPNFVLLVAASFFMYAGMWTPLFYLPTYAVGRGMDPALASYMLAVLNAASTLGRIVPGVLADKFGRINIFALGGLATGIVVCCLPKAETVAAVVVYAVCVGFASGTIISGSSAAFSLCPRNPQEFGTYMGMGMAVSSLAVLMGPPVNGKFVDVYGGFFEASLFSGVMCVVGSIIAFSSKMTTTQGLLGRV